MQKKIVLLALCLLQYALVQASSPVFTPKPQPASTESEYLCNIPAPTNFQVTRLGTNAVELSWDLNPQAAGGYRIRTYRASDNALVSTIENSMDIVTAVVTGLSAGEAYYSVLNSRCQNNINSPTEASVSFIVNILELIVIGYQGTQGPLDCTLDSPGTSCPFSPEGSTFLIGNTDGSLKLFRMKRNNSLQLTPYDCLLGTNGSEQPYFFNCGTNIPPTPNCSTDLISIKNGGNTIATFTVSVIMGVPHLVCIDISNGYFFKKFGAGTLGGERDQAQELTPAPSSFASPNPFANVLDVFPGRPEAKNIQLQLFNLSGQKVLDQQFGGGQEQYTLSTEGLSSGFYLLRIEADGEVQTLKVIKSE